MWQVGFSGCPDTVQLAHVLPKNVLLQGVYRGPPMCSASYPFNGKKMEHEVLTGVLLALDRNHWKNTWEPKPQERKMQNWRKEKRGFASFELASSFVRASAGADHTAVATKLSTWLMEEARQKLLLLIDLLTLDHSVPVACLPPTAHTWSMHFKFSPDNIFFETRKMLASNA